MHGTRSVLHSVRFVASPEDSILFQLAQVYEAADGTVEVTPSNCVQCGAITAKGGRLTPPEGGSGPEYTLT